MGTLNNFLDSIGTHNWAVLLVLLAAAFLVGIAAINVRLG